MVTMTHLLKIQYGHCCSEIPRILFWCLSRSNDRLIWMNHRDIMRSSTQRSSADDVITSVIISVPICSHHIPFPISLPVSCGVVRCFIKISILHWIQKIVQRGNLFYKGKRFGRNIIWLLSCSSVWRYASYRHSW